MADAAIPVSAENWLYERYGRADLRALMKVLVNEKRTGSLTLHFNQGAIGSLEWKQKCQRTGDSGIVLTRKVDPSSPDS